MGNYINPRNDGLQEALASEILVDKSLFLKKISGFINTEPKFISLSRPRHTAIKQIKNKKYPAGFENYLDNLLLVGVNYDTKTKVHECVIEKYQK